MLRTLQVAMLFVVLAAVVVAAAAAPGWSTLALATGLVAVLFGQLVALRQVERLQEALDRSVDSLMRQVTTATTAAPGASYYAGDQPHAAAGQEGKALQPTDDDIGSIWLEHSSLQSLADGDEEISFLPPYASEASAAELDEAANGAAADFEEAVARFGAATEPVGTVETVRNVPIPRHFALGTVAIIQELMDPEQVAQVILEQRRQPRLKFGELAVEMNFVTEAQLEHLLIAQQEGLFTDEEISRARARLKAYREREAAPEERLDEPSAGLPELDGGPEEMASD